MPDTTDDKAGSAARSERFRQAIAEFIDTRREAKLKGREDDAAAAAKYDYETWLADAASRARHLQSVTHPLKATHSSAKGSNLYCSPSTLPNHKEIGTHSLGKDFIEDTAISDAKHLDVFSFLKQLIDGRRFLDWIRDDDPDARSALLSYSESAHSWIESFKGLLRENESIESHTLAKQIYWLVSGKPSHNENFHLLQPMFSSSLAQRIHDDIQTARFGDANKALRNAKKTNQFLDGTYRDYRNLAVRKLGGANTQNVSRLNSERRGTNYLFSSLPPTWTQTRRTSLTGRESSTGRFFYFEDVRQLVRSLSRLLLSDPKKTLETRQKREAIEKALGAQLPLFAATIRDQFMPGWTRDPACELPLCEQLWLDPDRLTCPERPPGEGGEEDRAFEQAYHWGDWPDEVAGIFANWLNEQLRRAGVTSVGDVEYRHWARQAIVEAAWPVPMQRRAPEARS